MLWFIRRPRNGLDEELWSNGLPLNDNYRHTLSKAVFFLSCFLNKPVS